MITEAKRLMSERGLSVAIWLVVLVLGLARFINLGVGDLKDFDECLYAWRSKLCLFRGDWIDQSAYAWGGFWSAAFPPLQIWITAILFRLFGYSEFVARMYPALTGAGTVVILFLMGRRLGERPTPAEGELALPAKDRWTGLFAALFLGSTWFFTVYSRRNQFDVPSAFYIALSLYAYVAYLDRVRISGRRRMLWERGATAWLLLSGAALGLGLMNRIAIALMAPAIVGALALYGWMRGRHTFGRIVLEQAIINGVALLIILPWHLAITLSPKGAEFWRWYIGYHLLGRTSQTLHNDSGEWHYYIGHLWRQLPMPVLALTLLALPYAVWIILSSLRTSDRTTEPIAMRPLDYPDMRYLFPVLWFAMQFAVFTISSTKRDTYTVTMYPALALLAAIFLGERLRDSRRLGWLTATLFALMLVGVLSRMRSLGRQLEAMGGNMDEVALYSDVIIKMTWLTLAVLALAVGLRLVFRRRPELFRRLSLTIILCVTVVLSYRDVRRVFDREKGTRRLGWQEIRPALDDLNYDALVFAGQYADPEAMYYFNGFNPPFAWNQEVRFVSLERYDEKPLEQFDSGAKVRVVTMRSWLEKWTPEDRRRLAARLDLLIDSGREFAVYRLRNSNE